MRVDDFSVLDVLDEEERRRVLASTTRRRFSRNEVIFHEGDPGNTLHLIDRGHVKISILSPLGDIATLAILGSGDFFGEQALLARESERTATATALSATQTLSLRSGDFDDLRQRNSQVAELLLSALAAQVRRLSSQVIEARYLPADARIARQLRAAVELFRANGEAGPVDIPLSQEDLAQLAGTTRPTVNRFLKSLGNAVEVGRGRVTVLDAAALPDDA